MAYQFTDKQLIGVWNVTGDTLYARTFDNGQTFYLTQQTGTNPDRFVVRGRNLIIGGNVTLNQNVPQSAYQDFAGGDTPANGLYSPAFATPVNYTQKSYADGTLYYEANGNVQCTLTEGLKIGTFNPTGQDLVATQQNGKWYLAQLVKTSPRTIVIRGKNILTTGYATVDLATCVNAFTSADTGNNGLYSEPSFTTPNGYSAKVYPDGTPYFEQNSAAVAPIISVNIQPVNGVYNVPTGQAVTISANTPNINWYKRINGNVQKIVLYDQTITYTPTVTGEEVYAVYFLNGVPGAESNALKFNITDYVPAQSAAPTVETANVVVGQPINIKFCEGATQDNIEVYKNGTKLNPDQYYFAGVGLQVPGQLTLIPQSPAVNDKYKFKVTCPGMTISGFSAEVTLITSGSSICDSIVDRTALGVWTPQNGVLKARKFGATLWVTQDVTTSGGPDAFIVRGKNMLTRSDVSTQFAACSGSFSGSNTGSGGIIGLVEPNEFLVNMPEGYVRKAFPDGTPYYELVATTKPAAPTISTGASGKVGTTINGNVNQGGTILVFKDAQQITTITGVKANEGWSFNPQSAGIYSFKLQILSGGTSDFSPVVNVTGSTNSGACSINDKQEIGTWNVGTTSFKLIARLFNGELSVTQQTGVNPDTFVVRGRNILTRDDVTSNYKACTGVFAGGDTQANGLYPPANFQTPAGYQRKTYADSTIYYEAVGGSSGETGSTADFDLNFTSSCGATLEYAVSKTIADPTNPALVYQSSKRFSLSTGTWYFHARDKNTPTRRKTQQELITV